MKSLQWQLSAIALACVASVASAAPVIYNYSGTIQTYAVPTTGFYTFTVRGGSGGGDAPLNALGGQGAQLTQTFFLNAGASLQILVGGAAQLLGGGGGGTFVVGPRNTAFLVAGGGAGSTFAAVPGQDSTATAGDGSGGTGGARLATVGGASGGGGFGGDGTDG